MSEFKLQEQKGFVVTDRKRGEMVSLRGFSSLNLHEYSESDERICHIKICI